MAALILLLVVGGCPPEGLPAVYKSPVVLTLGALTGLLSLWAGWRIAVGVRIHLLCGIGCLFFAGVGVCGIRSFGAKSAEMAAMGGPMWFGAAAMVCMALVSILFAIIFGYLTLKMMTQRLWLAALHLCIPITLAGAYLDYAKADISTIRVPVGHSSPILIPAAGNRPDSLLRFTGFHLERHQTGETYHLLSHTQGRWEEIATPERRGDDIVHGNERWAVSELKDRPYMLLPGTPLRALVKSPPPVKEYRVDCSYTTRDEKGGEIETVDETLRVNSPISHEGWSFYLMSYRPLSETPDDVEIDVYMRHAPGDLLVLIGLLGCVLCTAGLCLSPNKSAKA